MSTTTIRGTAFLVWDYPDIYGPHDYVTLDLSHTRAADPIRIHYDAERDGWVIEQAAVFAWPAEDTLCDNEWAEVAFVKAWAREKAP